MDKQKVLIPSELYEKLMVSGNHLSSSMLGEAPPSGFISYQEALHAQGQPYADMWIAWRAIMNIRNEVER